MKKVFFSVVALVSFSFAGMANEIEEKKVETEIKLQPCLSVLIEAHDAFVNEGMDDSLAWEWAGLIYNDYKANGKCGFAY